MGPPPKNLKRKINVEAHGDPPRAAPNSQQAHTGAIRSSMGPASYTSSSSKNFAGRHSTATRNSSFGNSLGPDRRGFSKQYDRPQSAMLDTRTQRASSSTYRSNSSLDTHSRPPNGPQGVSNQGRISFLSTLSEVYKSPTTSESHGCYDPQIEHDADWESPCARGRLRDVSVTSALKSFYIDGKTTPMVEMNASLSPSHIPLRACTSSARGDFSSFSRSPKKPPLSGLFLTRESNTPAAWNTADKIEEMEHMHSELRQTIGGATYDATMLKEMMADYRMRSGCMRVTQHGVRLMYK